MEFGHDELHNGRFLKRESAPPRIGAERGSNDFQNARTDAVKIELVELRTAYRSNPRAVKLVLN
jgi:hypothetical protein